MAVGVRNDDGEFVAFFPSHDPDLQDEGLRLEVEEGKALDRVIEVARWLITDEALPHQNAGGALYIEGQVCFDLFVLRLAVQAYDAAVAANRAHDAAVGAREGDDA